VAAGAFSGFVASNDKVVVISFRGTANIEDWLSDADASQVQDSNYGGLVHAGFAQAMNTIWPLMQSKLPSAIGSRRLWVTGHSLGAALATLAALRLKNENVAVSAVYTYGSPRVGNPDFYSVYSLSNYRFVNNNDIVPHVPLPITPLGLRLYYYKHVGTLEYLNRQGQLGEGMSSWDVKKDFMMTSLLKAGGQPELDMLKDHSIANYVAAIQKNLAT